MGSEQLSGRGASLADFTVDGYRAILAAAKSRYKFVSYSSGTRSGNVLFLRHDCDVSLNRALRIARVEAEAEVAATYFLNPHCRFHSLLERGQADLVTAIIGLGHEIGLHFDAHFYGVARESELDALIADEASWLHEWFGSRPKAVSFHNPDAFTLSCEREQYGGLVNCYSASFKREVGYCSDSNGYWRHRRIFDVVSGVPTGPLQVLTHPDWWQESPMFPRSRVMRAAVGRAQAAMLDYDSTLGAGGRENLAGPSECLRPLGQIFPDQVVHLDQLWNAGQLDLVYLGLRRLLATLSHGDAPADEISSSLIEGKSVATDVLEQACIRLSEAIVSHYPPRSEAERGQK